MDIGYWIDLQKRIEDRLHLLNHEKLFILCMVFFIFYSIFELFLFIYTDTNFLTSKVAPFYANPVQLNVMCFIILIIYLYNKKEGIEKW